MATSSQDLHASHQNHEQGTSANEPEASVAATMASTSTPAVRFQSSIQEIAPAHSLHDTPPTISREHADEVDPMEEVTPDQIRALAESMQANPLQEKRMNIFSFEPYSLPASRTPSHESDSRSASREQTGGSSTQPSPLLSPRRRDAQSPPPTPPATGNREEISRLSLPRIASEKHLGGRETLTPHDSTQDSVQGPSQETTRATTPDVSPTSTSQEPAKVPVAEERPVSEHAASTESVGHRRGMFATGASTSQPASRDSSPGRASSHYTRPFTPAGDAADPYAASRRQPQSQTIEPRFVFTRKKGRSSPSSSTTSLPRAATTAASAASEKRHPTKLGSFGRGTELAQHDSGGSSKAPHGSMSNLKRFFKLEPSKKVKRASSPTPSARGGAKMVLASKQPTQIPFGDDHGLTSKYGKFGRVLGSGAGGSVRLMKRNEDNTVFAVKEFRARHSHETEKDYTKKLTAEYCIGSSLHHGNIIEALDIVHEKGKWFEVMEYAPFDLFAIVMTGRMSREEVSCAFLQILSGVTYLHSMGLAHRDMKLDNVVVNEHGIMKIIDFGSAHVYKYPFESSIVLASGIVGSDPYLAPEVYEERKYDPQAVDIWSLAIIFCCMTLRRFPWKVPRMTDNSYKLFAAEPTPGHDPKKLALPPAASTADVSNTPDRDSVPEASDDKSQHHHRRHRGSRDETKNSSSGSHTAPTAQPVPVAAAATATVDPEKKEIVRGPWRILRLLPRESRHIIGRMLEIDPKKRATMAEILDDPWVSNTVICRQTEPGQTILATDHTHILEPPASVAAK